MLWTTRVPSQLPDEINEAVRGLYAEAVAIEHRWAILEKVPPVRESVVKQFRTVDEEATVEEIRDAALGAIEALRQRGESVLEFRPGLTPVDRALDFIDAAV
ncbi:hypothetical protein ACQCSX_22520 (plasmid) [Pseudarthrobacter sp. P1]|uniref:hypothetical protein n=1 Tax=Pseudarthrobacter sp. P1 TaxID=3418418 RepID=UPI003CF52984